MCLFIKNALVNVLMLFGLKNMLIPRLTIINPILFVNFNSDDVREKMRARYLSNPDYNYEKVNRASVACGPMVKWAIAQVNDNFIFYPLENKKNFFSFRLNTLIC